MKFQSYLLLLFGLYFYHGMLSAQDLSTPEKPEFNIGGWQLSAKFSTPLHKDISLSIETPDSLRASNNRFNLPIRPFRTIKIDGQEIDYFLDASITVSALLPSFWFSASLGVHRQFLSGISLSAEITYGRQEYTAGVNTTDELPGEFDAFTQITSANQFGGIEFGIDYHLWRTKRFQLYGGLLFSFMINHSISENPFIYSILGYNYQEVREVLDRQRERTLFNNDLAAQFGFLYRLSPKWSLGLKSVGLLIDLGYRPNIGLEVRYWFNQ